MDEPESLAALGLAAREGLDNLTFVINCNLQRLDGPVRGNGKVIEELEAQFLGAGWNVIKVLWGSEWDALLDQDHDGVLQHYLDITVDGEYQSLSTLDGAARRQRFSLDTHGCWRKSRTWRTASSRKCAVAATTR